jgi:hypothetical protein
MEGFCGGMSTELESIERILSNHVLTLLPSTNKTSLSK